MEKVFNTENIRLTDKVVENNTAQLRGEDQLNKKVAVDIIDKGLNNVRIEVRCGISEETSARDLLSAIKRYLQ